MIKILIAAAAGRVVAAAACLWQWPGSKSHTPLHSPTFQSGASPPIESNAHWFRSLSVRLIQKIRNRLSEPDVSQTGLRVFWDDAALKEKKVESLEEACFSPLTAVWKQFLPTRTLGLSRSRYLMKPESITVNIVFIILPLTLFFFSSHWIGF